MAHQIAWIESHTANLPIGIAAAGLIHPATGLALTANLSATGKPFPADIETASNRKITYVNDCRAQTLSEAQFGAAKGYRSALSLNLGTGLAGGIVLGDRLLQGPSGLGGEFGHFTLPATTVLAHNLPILRCGCGRLGCTETLIAGPGLSRIVAHLTNRTLRPEDIVRLRQSDPDIAKCWAIWCELTAELIHTLTLTVDPACIVLAGGLSRAPNLIDDLTRALIHTALPGYPYPPLLLAQGGDTTGARGAAYAACIERVPA
jgi:predicted NBD/HSP70 family sugar kinase